MTRLIVENQDKPGSGVVTVATPRPEGLTNPATYVTNDQIRSVMSSGQAYHISNKLIIQLRPAEGDARQPVFHESMSYPGNWSWRIFFRDRTTSDTGFERDTFTVNTECVVDNVTITGGGSNVEIMFNSTTETTIEHAFDRRGVTRPEFGFISFRFRALNRGVPESESSFDYIIKVTFEPLVTAVEVPGFVADPILARAEFTSKPLAFESLHVPTLSASFHYNFFEVDEDSLLSARRRRYNLQKLSSIPKYVELMWSPAPPVSLPITPVTGAVGRIGRESIIEGGERPVRRSLTPGGEATEDFLGTFSDSATYDLGGPRPSPDTSPFLPGGGGGRIIPEDPAETGFTGIYSGIIYTVGGFAEEEAAIFGSRTSSARLVREGSRRPGYVAGDSTISLGLPEQEDLLLREMVRNTDEPDALAGPNEWSRYIGYVLLKERYNPDEERFEPIDIIAVLDRRKSRIVDTKIAYGDTYRYKVRSVFKFVNVDDLPLFRDQDSLFSSSLSGAIRSVFDGGIPFKNAFYFDSKFSNPADVVAIESKRPDPPRSLLLYPNSEKKEIFITWVQKQQERDVAGFNIYRRPDTTGSIWSRLNNELIPLRKNFFMDRLVEPDISYIYAVESIDQHDNFSKLSIQPKVSLRPQDFSCGRMENPTQIHLNKETEFDEVEKPEESDIIKFKDKLKLVVNPLFGNLDREAHYLLLIKSLDTFQEKEVKLNFITKVITHSGAVTLSDDTFAERRDRITEAFREAERQRFGLTSDEAQRRRDRRTDGREGFEE